MQMIKEIKITCHDMGVREESDSRYLVCLSDGICLEFKDRRKAEDRLRNIERCGLTTKRWRAHAST